MGAGSLDEPGAEHLGSTLETALSRASNARRIERSFAVERTRRLQELDSL
jgi:hypothetical protein